MTCGTRVWVKRFLASPSIFAIDQCGWLDAAASVKDVPMREDENKGLRHHGPRVGKNSRSQRP
jgi:hypothetical protein